MADQVSFLASGAIGLGPALFFMWHSLRRFDYPRVEKTLFDDRKVFLALAVGLVIGTVSSVFAVYSPQYDVTSVLVLIVFIMMFEESFKLVYLNRKGYRLNFASTFYGFSLGLGVATTVVLATGLRNPGTLLTAGTAVLLLVYSTSVSAAESATGALIGLGCSKGEPWSYFFVALFARFFYTLMAFPFLLSTGPDWLLLASLFAALATGLGLYYYSYSGLMIETLPPEFRRKSRKSRRARLRADKG